MFTIHAQNDVYTTSKHTKFSLLTCGPGEELYTRFGHTALRLHDDSVNIDVVFNYGLFDFNTPNFYLKFMNGELDYLLGYGSYGRFIASYTRENREVREAEIILSDNEKEVLWRLLSINLQPENRAYRYDFFFDNCATRVRDLLFKVKNIPLPYQPTGVTYRQLLHEKNTSNSWSAQGIDLLLGANTDSIASVSGRAFLPDYLEALCKENGLITTPKIVVNPIIEDEENIVNIPNLLFTLLILLTVLFTIYESKQKQLNKWFDITLLIPFILLSLLFMYMWFISSHLICKWNWNLLWASPILIILLISILKEIPAKRIMIQLALVDATLVAFIMLSIFAIEYFSNIAYLSAATLAIRVNYRLYYTYNLTFRKK
ncbi:MAG: DUF4105 domain-containing protein [Bacteroidia bacterium]|nr:DUF4105 domain-containing protein [Bacteroidia bacterium]